MAAPHVDLVVRGGRVVTSTEVLETAVAVSGGKIVALGAEAMLPAAERTIEGPPMSMFSMISSKFAPGLAAVFSNA